MLLACLAICFVTGLLIFTDIASENRAPASGSQKLRHSHQASKDADHPQSVKVVLDETAWKYNPARAKSRNEEKLPCIYQSLNDVAEEELYPKKGERHMIDPPQGGKVSLVCCDTTAGPLNILAHHKWAPLGAERFMAMVTSGYFNTSVPFMRCVPGFLCQFGLNSDKAKRADFHETILDDPNWLPQGPKFRQNENGVKRFAKGYMAYAGSGENSRSKQLIVALKGNGPLAGGSPWEVPWGELVHKESFDTLMAINTEYGENGPPQAQLGRQGMTDEMKRKYPRIDYINQCMLMDERILPEKNVTKTQPDQEAKER